MIGPLGQPYALWIVLSQPSKHRKVRDMSDVCIMHKYTGPWWYRTMTRDTVICGLIQAEGYFKQGYQFDWPAMRYADLQARSLARAPLPVEAVQKGEG